MKQNESESRNLLVVAASAHDGQDDVARFDALEDGDGLGVRESHQRLVVHG